MSPRPRSALLLLLLGIAGVSSASLWIRLSDDEPGALAFRRLFLALPFLAVWAWARRVPITPGPGQLGRLLVPGLALAAHFYLWIASLEYLSVSVSVLLVSLHPVLVFFVEWARQRVRVTGWACTGIVSAVAGAALLSWPASGGGDSENPLLGALLAVAGAVAMAVYLLQGRTIQRSMPAPTYVISVYGIAAVAVGLFELESGHALFPEGTHEWRYAFALAIFPTVFGHTPMNVALRTLPATVISVSFLAEAIGASLLVWLVLSESPPASILGGGPLVAAGILLTGRLMVRRSGADTSGAKN